MKFNTVLICGLLGFILLFQLVNAGSNCVPRSLSPDQFTPRRISYTPEDINGNPTSNDDQLELSPSCCSLDSVLEYDGIVPVSGSTTAISLLIHGGQGTAIACDMNDDEIEYSICTFRVRTVTTSVNNGPEESISGIIDDSPCVFSRLVQLNQNRRVNSIKVIMNYYDPKMNSLVYNINIKYGEGAFTEDSTTAPIDQTTTTTVPIDNTIPITTNIPITETDSTTQQPTTVNTDNTNNDNNPNINPRSQPRSSAIGREFNTVSLYTVMAILLAIIAKLQ